MSAVSAVSPVRAGPSIPARDPTASPPARAQVPAPRLSAQPIGESRRPATLGLQRRFRSGVSAGCAAICGSVRANGGGATATSPRRSSMTSVTRLALTTATAATAKGTRQCPPRARLFGRPRVHRAAGGSAHRGMQTRRRLFDRRFPVKPRDPRVSLLSARLEFVHSHSLMPSRSFTIAYRSRLLAVSRATPVTSATSSMLIPASC